MRNTSCVRDILSHNFKVLISICLILVLKYAALILSLYFILCLYLNPWQRTEAGDFANFWIVIAGAGLASITRPDEKITSESKHKSHKLIHSRFALVIQAVTLTIAIMFYRHGNQNRAWHIALLAIWPVIVYLWYRLPTFRLPVSKGNTLILCPDTPDSKPRTVYIRNKGEMSQLSRFQFWQLEREVSRDPSIVEHTLTLQRYYLVILDGWYRRGLIFKRIDQNLDCTTRHWNTDKDVESSLYRYADVVLDIENASVGADRAVSSLKSKCHERGFRIGCYRLTSVTDNPDSLPDNIRGLVAQIGVSPSVEPTAT